MNITTVDGWDGLPLTPEHARYLADHAITPAVAGAAGITSVSVPGQLPEGLGWVADRDGVPGIVFPWREPDGTVKPQYRPDTPIDLGDGRPAKYVFGKGSAAQLGQFRVVDGDTILIVEGTKQSLVAAAYAPDNVSVYGIAGCRMWSQDGVPTPHLAVCDDKTVLIALDADAASNLEVYEAGLNLADALRAEGARAVKFVRIPGGKKSGLDDILGQRAADRRTAYLARLLGDAKPKPADARPKAQRTGSSGVTPAPTGPVGPVDRSTIYVDGDRLEVINNITAALLDRWNASRLFNHGEVISQLVRHHLTAAPEMKPLLKGAFHDLLQETAATVRHGQNDELVYSWPDGQSIDAVMSRANRFAPLDRIARAPFVRPDGTICQANGYDEATSTLVVMDPALSNIAVPDAPTEGEVALARKLLIDDWLVDFPFHTDADRANALGLILTPFVRGQMGVVPLAVVDGLQMGVGKNLLADCFMLLAVGTVTEPLPFSRDDEEVRKNITSAFRTGADVFVFDEAHVLEGAALARALTSATYKDRQLGVSQMLGFPNRVTWVSLGNQVRVEGDIVRRVYRIALRPTTPNPHERPSTSFRHSDLRDWTMRNRGELLTAALTLIRSWFANGCPSPAGGVSFGSFEKWERIVGGIVENAGQPGFLTNLQEWRSETSFELGYWTGHMQWLHDTFGGREFTCHEVRDAMVRDMRSVAPPGMTDGLDDGRTYNRRLGQAYARQVDRFFGHLQFLRAETGRHDNTKAWRVVTNGGGSSTQSDTPHTPGGSGGNGGIPTPTHVSQKTHAPPPDAHACSARGDQGPEDPPVTPLPPSLGGITDRVANVPDQSTQSDTPHTQGLFDLPLPTPVDYPRVELATFAQDGEIDLPDGVVVFDIESTDSSLWPTRPDFIRITGVQQGKTIRVTADAAEVADLLRSARLVVGHNIMGFDLMAFALHHGVDLHELADQGRVVDTMLTEIVTNPPEARTKQGRIMRDYGLDNLGNAKFGVGKTDDLSKLAGEHGGYDKIPLDDERYASYCAGDVNLTARLAKSQPRPEYAKREHRVAAIAARIRINGFRVDTELLSARVEAGQARRAELIGRLRDRYGLPVTKKDGKPSKSPHATTEGRAAIVQAFTDLGVVLTSTPAGLPALGKEEMERVTEQHSDEPAVLELVETVQSLNGVRTVYDTVQRCLVGDRVHPDITMFQASGRWSITEPGLTVMGKRGGKHVEREVFLPEPGHVLISADLSQVDARAVAAWCQDEAYLELFEPGRDSHTEIALAVWGDAGRRDDAKVLGHGYNYGMGIAKLAAKVGSVEVAREFDRSMRDRFPGLVEWKRQTAERADSGELLDNGFGRLLRTTPGYGWTQGPALLGQSAARDILMEGLLRLPRELHPYLRAVVHDEVVMSIPADRADEIEAQVMQALQFRWAPPGSLHTVGIEAGLANRGSSWGACYAK